MEISPQSGLRNIAWNDIQMQIPWDWELIVSGRQHLLLEKDFQPILEIRWEQQTSNKRSPDCETIIKKFQKATGQTIRRTALPPYLGRFAKNTRATGLNRDDQPSALTLFWHCLRGRRTYLCNLPAEPPVPLTSMQLVLESIAGCKTSAASKLWSIQDFRLQVPNRYSFVDYTIGAGLTRLAFSGNGQSVNYCRLAPADSRLQSTSLAAILSTLHDGLTSQLATDQKEAVEMYHSPSLFEQIRKRLQRKRPFAWGRIWHEMDHNRLLAVIVDSKQPIQPEMVHTLCADYEILTSETENGSTQPN